MFTSFWNFDVVELCLLITFWTSILISILYYYIDNCIRWIIVLEQTGGLHDVIRSLQLILRVFIKFGNFDGYGWVIFVDYFLDFNTFKRSIFVIMIIVLEWNVELERNVELEQAGDLHGVIKRFTFILRVFITFWKFGYCWVMVIDYFLDFNSCKHSILLYW